MILQKLNLHEDVFETLNALGKELEGLLKNGQIGDLYNTLGDLFQQVSGSASQEDLDEHNSDIDTHLNDKDREVIDDIDTYKDALEKMFNQTASNMNALKSSIADNKTVIVDQTQNLTKHVTDKSVHFDNRTQKDSVMYMAGKMNWLANFDNPVFMCGTQIKYDFTDTHIIETAFKGDVVFAERKTDITDVNNIIVEVRFWFDNRIVSVRQIFKTLADGSRKMIIEEIGVN